MNKLRILLYIFLFFAFEVSIAKAQEATKAHEDECAGALQGDKVLIEALEKMRLPNTPNPEKHKIGFWMNNNHVFNLRSEKEYTIQIF